MNSNGPASGGSSLSAGALGRNGAMLTFALVIGAQIPSTIEKIADPTVKALVQIVAVLVLVFIVLRIDPKAMGSMRPPPPPAPPAPPPSPPPSLPLA